MGVRDVILILLAIVITCVTVAVGIHVLFGQSVQANKDGLTAKLVVLAAHAHRLKRCPVVVGGGGGAYDNSRGASANYSVPDALAAGDKGRYLVSSLIVHYSCDLSLNGSAVVFCALNGVGRISFSYQGW